MKPIVLLAEDDAPVLKMTKLRLEHEGYNVIAVGDGERALNEALVNPKISVILLDLRMPKMSGLEVCRRLKKNPSTAKIPVIIFTASSASWQRLADQCIEVGVEDWLKKPFRSSELLARIRRALNEGGNGA